MGKRDVSGECSEYLKRDLLRPGASLAFARTGEGPKYTRYRVFVSWSFSTPTGGITTKVEDVTKLAAVATGTPLRGGCACVDSAHTWYELLVRVERAVGLSIPATCF